MKTNKQKKNPVAPAEHKGGKPDTESSLKHFITTVIVSIVMVDQNFSYSSE